MSSKTINRPISGQFPEQHFGQVTPYAMWVLFTEKDYQQWVGSFTRGYEGFETLIIELDEFERVFIIAGGEGYLIHTAKRQMLNSEDLTGIKTAIADKERKRVIFSDGVTIQQIGMDGQVAVLCDDHYFDDIELLEIRGDILLVRYWNYQKGSSPFSLELNLATKGNF